MNHCLCFLHFVSLFALELFVIDRHIRVFYFPFLPLRNLAIFNHKTLPTLLTAGTRTTSPLKAGTSASVSACLIASTVIELSTNNQSVAPFSVQISTKNNGVSSDCNELTSLGSSSEGPSCIFVGPIKTVRKQTLEALYQ